MISSPGLSSSKTIIIIPTRLASERFPNKPLAEFRGAPLVVHTARQAKKTGFGVLVTGPDREIAAACAQHGMNFMPTSPVPPNGTDRCFELARRMRLEPNDILINWQVDEPFVQPETVVALADILRTYGGVWDGEHCRPSICTIVAPNDDWGPADWENRNNVKVAVANNFCHWFSRAALGGSAAHVGVYAFWGLAALQAAAEAPQGQACKAERLEQLAWLESGMAILAASIDYMPVSINVPEDLPDES